MGVEIEPLLAFKTQIGVQRPACLSRDLCGKIIKTSNTCQQHNSVGNITSCHISNDNNERPEFSAMLIAVCVCPLSLFKQRNTSVIFVLV